MKKVVKTLILGVFLAASLGFIGTAFAYSPYLSVSGSTITISGAQPNAAVVITYMPSGSSLTTTITGTTDYNGYFSVQANSVTSQVSATVGGQPVYAYNNGGGGCGYYGCGGCTYNCGNSSGIILSQSSLSLSAGQSSTISILNGNSFGYNSYYISSNSNSSVATASVSGSSLYIAAGYQTGSASISVCQSSGTNACASLYVTVTGSSCTYYGCNNGSAISLSPSSLNLTSPQTANVSIIGGVYGNSGYYISSNTTPNAATASISGNILYVSSLFGGSTTITVCQSGNSSQCASLYVTVNGGSCSTYGCSGSGSLSLSQTSFNLTYGQSVTVSSNNASSLYVSSNSNSGVVSVTTSGNQAVFYGLGNGSSTVVLCGISSNQCASVYVTVNGSGSCSYNCGIGAISFSPSSVNINLGQSATVNIYNSYSVGSFYISSNSNSSVASASVSGNSLYLLAAGVGNTNITVCQNGISSCGTLYVTVSSVGGSGSFSLSQTSLSLNSGQTASITAYGSGVGIYISSNSNSAVAGYNISGNQINITALGVGSTTFSVCSNSGYGCSNLYVTVSGSSCSYYGCGNGTNISLSQSNLSLGAGQTSAITIYGSGSYYISSNSNSYVASAALAGNVLNVTALQNGTTNVYICQNGGNGQCVTLYVTVGGGSGYYGNTNVVLSQTNLNLSIGQTSTVNVSGNGGYGYYISSNSNPGSVSATFNGSALTVYGIQNGSSVLAICQNGASACASLTVNVGSGYSYGGGGVQYPGGSGGGVLGASTYPNGELIAEGQTVYIVYRGTQTAFSSAAVFTGLGFKFSNVLQVGSSGLPSSGHVISNIYTSHPWGTWIKNGSTVYLVQESGLIPVPDWATFINNGGSANLIVSANSYDFRLPILSPMVTNDPRLN